MKYVGLKITVACAGSALAMLLAFKALSKPREPVSVMTGYVAPKPPTPVIQEPSTPAAQEQEGYPFEKLTPGAKKIYIDLIDALRMVVERRADRCFARRDIEGMIQAIRDKRALFEELYKINANPEKTAAPKSALQTSPVKLPAP